MLTCIFSRKEKLDRIMAEAGISSKGTNSNPQEDKESKSVNMEEDMKAFRGKYYFRLLVSTTIFIILAWVFGRFGLGLMWLVPFLILVFSWWNRTSSEIIETSARLADIQAHRERAFKNAETAEWLNFIVNRW